MTNLPKASGPVFSENHLINLYYLFELYDNIAIDFINTSGAICFSSDGTWFQGNGGLLTGDVTHSVLYVCPLKNKVDRCIVNTEGIPNKQHEYIFEISWSRFGNVAMQKWNVKKGGGTWALQ